MAKFIVTAPDGKEYEITAPEGASQEEILAYAQAQFAQQQQPEAPQESPSAMSQLGRGVGLAGRGLAQSAFSGFGLGTLVGDPIMTMTGRPTTSQVLEESLTRMGFPEPVTAAERAGVTGLEVATSIGGQFKAAQQLIPRIAAQTAPTTTSRVAQVFSDDLAQQIAAGVPAAMTADYIANYAVANEMNPVETGIYTLAGGYLAGLLGAKTQRRLTREPIPIVTPKMAKERAQESYKKVSEAGITFKPASLQRSVTDIRKKLEKSEGGFYPDARESDREVSKLLDELNKLVEADSVSFEALEGFRSNMVTQSRLAGDGNIRRLLGSVISGLDDMVGGVQPSDLQGGSGKPLKEVLSSVRDARENWRRNTKATLLEDALEVALRKGEDPKASTGELIRNNFKNLYADKKKMKNFSKEEQEAIRQVVAGGDSLERLLSFAARFNPQRSQIMAGAAGFGLATNPLIAVPASVAGFAADKTLAVVQRQAAQNVMNKIASGKIPPPRSNAQWRALVEAEAKAQEGLGNVFAPQE